MKSTPDYVEGLDGPDRFTVVMPSGTAWIASFEPERYLLRRPIPVHLQSSGDQFIATFFDANITSSGDSEEEAFSNLKELILDTFDFFGDQEPSTLGPIPLRQMSVLREFIEPANAA